MDIMQFIKQLAGGAQNMFRRREPELISPIPEELPEFSHVDPRAMGDLQFEGQPPEMPMMPTATPTPTPQPTLAPESALFDFEPYRESGNFEIQQPPEGMGQAIRQVFGDKAEKAAVVMGTENPAFDPSAVNQNRDGSIDVGVFQVNSRTLEDFLRRKPKQLEKIGVDDVEDLYDPMKNMQVAKLILDEQGWGAWYGPGNKGYNLKEEGD